jgi:hypothetical protein
VNSECGILGVLRKTWWYWIGCIELHHLARGTDWSIYYESDRAHHSRVASATDGRHASLINIIMVVRFFVKSVSPECFQTFLSCNGWITLTNSSHAKSSKDLSWSQRLLVALSSLERGFWHTTNIDYNQELCFAFWVSHWTSPVQIAWKLVVDRAKSSVTVNGQWPTDYYKRMSIVKEVIASKPFSQNTEPGFMHGPSLAPTRLVSLDLASSFSTSPF